MAPGKPTETREKRPFRIPWTLVAITLGLMIAAGGAGLLASPVFEATKKYENDWLALVLLIGGLFLANMARMLSIWRKFRPIIRIQPTRRLMEERRIAEQGFKELFAYLFAAFAFLTALSFLSSVPSFLPWRNLGLNGLGTLTWNPVHVSVLIGTLGLSLVPLVTAFWMQGLEEERSLSRKLFRDDAIGASSFWMSAGLLFAIVILANWAAQASQSGHDGLEADLAYWITFAIVALFVAFIFLPHVQRYVDDLAERERDPNEVANTPLLVGAPAIATSWLDSLLVRLVAPLTGATQHGPLVPHGFVVLSLLPMTALGFILPQPYGLAPIGLGMLMIIALGRRWAWIEEDREMASRLLRTDGKEIQIGFENDLKDEALLGYAFLFILVPLSLHQINGVANAFTGVEGAPISDPFFAWLSFFGGELAKAVPFVDWWEIYSVNIDSPVRGVCADAKGSCSASGKENDIVPLAKHLTFASRAMVDLVIMAALFQAIGIWQRSRAQDRLYDAGQLDAFDPFTEARFFKRGMKRTAQGYIPRLAFEERIEEHMSLRKDLQLPKVPYNQFRLGELLVHQDDEVRAGAEWMLAEFGVLAGTPTQKLQQLSEQWKRDWFAGSTETKAMITLAKEEQQHWRRSEKLRLEQLLDELVDNEDEKVPTFMGRADVANLLQIVAIAGGAAEFHFARVVAMELLAKIPDPNAFWALAAQVCRSGPCLSEWQRRIEGMFDPNEITTHNGICANSCHGRKEMRALGYKAIAEQATGYEDGDPMLLTILDFLHCAEACGENKGAAEALRRAIENVEVLSPNANVPLKSPALGLMVLHGDDEDED